VQPAHHTKSSNREPRWRGGQDATEPVICSAAQPITVKQTETILDTTWPDDDADTDQIDDGAED
jgi:hypothetical protein